MQAKKDRHLTLAVKQFKVIWLLLFRAGAIRADLGEQPTWGGGKYWINFVNYKNVSCYSLLH